MLTSQIDLVPTLLGMLNLNYTSRFLGYDIFRLPAGRERAFTSTYQDLGYIKDSELVILSPQQRVEAFTPNFLIGVSTKISPSSNLINEAIAWYQIANYLYTNG